MNAPGLEWRQDWRGLEILAELRTVTGSCRPDRASASGRHDLVDTSICACPGSG